MNPERIAELRCLLAEATPGPWEDWTAETEEDAADARLIAALVTAAPELLDALDHWRECDKAQRDCHAVYVESAQAEIARLTRERDELYATTVDLGRSVVALTRERDEATETSIGLRMNLACSQALSARLERERDEAVLRAEKAERLSLDVQAKLFAMAGERDEARAVLLDVEWVDRQCKVCDRWVIEGHATDCALVRALGGG